MKNFSLKTLALLLCVWFPVAMSIGCGQQAAKKAAEAKEESAAEASTKVGQFTPTILENGESSHIMVQHILIAFKGSIPSDRVTRSKEEAEKLAKKVYELAQGGESFDALVSKYTDDDVPGIYLMANFFQQDDRKHVNASKRVMPRDGMVAAFGDVGFPLKVGEMGLAEYDEEKSKYGWHIIKRVR